MRRTLIVMAVAVLLGCSAVSSSTDSLSLDGTAWVLSSLAAQPALVGSSPTARFEGGRIQGSDGCNRYTMPYRFSGSAFEAGPSGAATQMACPPDVMKQASAFASALTSARIAKVKDGNLELLADGAVLATFRAQSRTLAGTSWNVTGINNGREAVVSLVAGSTVTLTFGADGRAAGSAGCNQYTAGYLASGPKLVFKAPAATRKMCADSAVMEQEQAFLKALETVATMRFEGNRLELRTASGALAATLNRTSGP